MRRIIRPKFRVAVALALLILYMTLAGCKSQKAKPVPPYPRPVAMKVILEEGIELGDGKQREFKINRADIERVYALVKPTEWCNEKIKKKSIRTVARIIATHPNGENTELVVHDMGQHPAVVTFDGKDYYWADSGLPGDGAVHLLKLLNPDNHLLSDR